MEHNPFELPQSDGPKGSRLGSLWKPVLVFGWVIFLALLCAFVVWDKVSNQDNGRVTKADETAEMEPSALSGLEDASSLTDSAKYKTLEVNGQLKVNQSLILDPSDPPTNPIMGQVYYDKSTNKPMYYDGQKFVAVANQDDIATLQASRQQVVQVNTQMVPQPTVVVDVPVDIAQTGSANTFTNNNLFDQDVAVNGTTSLQSTSIASLMLGQPLSVTSGGTGVSTLAMNGVLLGNGTAGVSSTTAGSAGLCLMSTNGAPSFQTCPSTGSTPDAVTSTGNTSGALAKFGAANTLVDSLLSENGSTIYAAGMLNLNTNSLLLGSGAFGTTLNTSTLSANRSIVLPNESGTICLQSAASCGFAAASGSANYIQNQSAVDQTADFSISGRGVANRFQANDHFGQYFDARPGFSEMLIIGFNNASSIRIGHYGINTVVGGALTVNNGAYVADHGLTLAGISTSYTTPLGATLSTMINIPNYQLPAFGTILGFGVQGNSAPSARALTVADARTVDHQPTIGILSPDENQVFGLSFDGSNTTGYVKASSSGIGIRTSSSTDVALFQGNQISLYQNTQVTGGLRVATDSGNAFVVQNASAVELLKADTNTMKLTVRELEVTNNLAVGGNLTVGGHIRTNGATPTHTAGPAACTAPTVAVTGTDTAGMITVTAGTGCGTTGALAAVIFANAFSVAPKVTLTPATSSAAGLQTFVDYDNVLTTSFDITTNTALTNGAMYRWYYHAIE